ncbi:MAG TPA: class I adenylate-forming enzyme family protein [Micromonosporaceae bacterium]|jgi:acyl-coenzyme A synthetase/AMP-(fatty) acid ligase
MNIRAALGTDPQVGAGNVLASLIRHGAAMDGPGLTFDTAVDAYPAWHEMTLGELVERVKARAAWLHAHGVKPRDPIAVYAGDAADVVLSFLALTWLGAIPALLNGNVAGDIAEIWIGRLRAEGVLVDAEHAARLRATGLTTPILGDVTAIGSADPADAPAAYTHHGCDPISITHSSGTTGVPKAIVHSNDSLFAATRKLRLSVPRAQGTERVLCALPAAHTAGILAVNQALCNRAELVFLSSQHAEPVLDAIERWHPTGVFGFAVTWAEMARFDLSTRDMASVAIWFNTGDCAHEAHIRPLVAVGSRKTVTRDGVVTVTGSSFIDGLGSTEMGHSAFHITHRSDTDHYSRCIGKAHLFADVTVLELDGSATPTGSVGYLGLRSPTVMLGYWNDSVNTFRSNLGGYYLTGDLVYADDEGYYYHMDRAVDSVALGGGRFLYTALSEERVLRACPDVSDCTVIAVRDGETVMTDVMLLLVVGAAVDDQDRDMRVRAALGPDVAATIRKVIAVDGSDLPTGATGKVRKLVLRQRYTEDRAAVAS